MNIAPNSTPDRLRGRLLARIAKRYAATMRWEPVAETLSRLEGNQRRNYLVANLLEVRDWVVDRWGGFDLKATRPDSHPEVRVMRAARYHDRHAFGARVPRTESVLYLPFQPPERIEERLTWDMLRGMIGGYIVGYDLGDGRVVVFDEDAPFKSPRINESASAAAGFPLVGRVVVTSQKVWQEVIGD